jgi:hypothetical protein
MDLFFYPDVAFFLEYYKSFHIPFTLIKNSYIASFRQTNLRIFRKWFQKKQKKL